MSSHRAPPAAMDASGRTTPLRPWITSSVSGQGFPMNVDLVEQLPPARRVIVVDDHPSFRRSAKALLTAEGFEVVGEAVDGASALAAVAELAPELVLLDIQLPDIDGFEVARRLLESRPELRIVLVSSRDSS